MLRLLIAGAGATNPRQTGGRPPAGGGISHEMAAFAAKNPQNTG